MSTFAVDKSNNLILKNSTFSILDGQEGTMQAALHYTRTIRGEMIHDIGSGVRYLETAFNAPRLQLLRADIIARIKQAPNVEAVSGVEIMQTDGRITYSAKIRTSFGTVEVASEII